jgi:hypothetical protein
VSKSYAKDGFRDRLKVRIDYFRHVQLPRQLLAHTGRTSRLESMGSNLPEGGKIKLRSSTPQSANMILHLTNIILYCQFVTMQFGLRSNCDSACFEVTCRRTLGAH